MSDPNNITPLLVEMSQALGRVEGKLDDRINVVVDHETRLRKLERWRWVLLGAGIVGAWVLTNLQEALGFRL